jgi:aconitate hydratase
MVLAESFERIHRSNLIGMGILPLEFMSGDNRFSLQLTGKEQLTVRGLNQLIPGQEVVVEVIYADGTQKSFHAKCRLDTQTEKEYFYNGGILQYVLRKLVQS